MAADRTYADAPAAAALGRARRRPDSPSAACSTAPSPNRCSPRRARRPAPDWITRPDLRIPALTVLRSEHGVSSDPIFIAPYNAPGGQAGAVIADNSGEPIWEHPLAGKVTTNFRVQRYRGEPVLTWWEGYIELGHGVGEYVIADTAYRTVAPRAGLGGGLRGDLHEFVITPRGTALLTSYVVDEGGPLAPSAARATAPIQDAIFQEIDLASGERAARVAQPRSRPVRRVLRRRRAADCDDYFHINSDRPRRRRHAARLRRAARTRSTRSTRSGRGRSGASAASTATSTHRPPAAASPGSTTCAASPTGRCSVFDNGATPAVEKLSRALILERRRAER